MNRLLLALLLVLAAHPAAACPSAGSADWMTVSDALAAPVRPPDCAIVEQTPPDFGWPDAGPGVRYTLELTYPDGRTRTLPVPQNWANWPEALPPGEYRWTVSALEAQRTRKSQPRRFTVPREAVAFVVPDMEVLLARVKAKPHPRGLPDGATLREMARQRAEGVAALRAQLERQLRAPLPPEPHAEAGRAAKSAVMGEVKRALSALAGYALVGDERYRADALRRVQNLASWDPEGPTAYHVRGMDMSARALTWALTLGYDWLHPHLDARTRQGLLATIGRRLEHMHDDTLGARSRVARHPRDSHGQLTVAMLGVMATLVAGELPRADSYVRAALPLGVNLTMPWGGEDGGFANGTAYAIWDVGESLSYWYVLRWAADLDLARKAWVRNFTRYLVYFSPPGTPAGLFGDGHEFAQLDEARARFGKGFAYFAPSPLGRWYAARLAGEDARRFESLLAPPADFSGMPPLPKGTPNGYHLPSIGWVAMHSDLADPARVSVYFKSSPPPFGAFNHQHADQNALVVNAGGERLAIESGYYDGYKSRHWREWLKTTQAKNAITYDGGAGQAFFEDGGRMGYGRITRFLSTAEYDIATGDAAAAYGGALDEALRSVVFLRPHLIVVHDRLRAAAPRRWEWNIHALRQMKVVSERSIRIDSGAESLCVQMLAGPQVSFKQTDQWTAAPANGEPQWHGRFVTAPLAAAQFIVLMNVGCREVQAAAAEARVRVGRWTVDLSGDQVLVRH